MFSLTSLYLNSGVAFQKVNKYYIRLRQRTYFLVIKLIEIKKKGETGLFLNNAYNQHFAVTGWQEIGCYV